MSSRLRDARGRFVADQNAIQAEIAQTNQAFRSMKSFAAQATSAVNNTIRSVRSAGNQLGSALGSMQGQLLAAAGVGSVGGLAFKAVNDASNNAENLSKFGAVFAEHTAEATAFVKDLADDLGCSGALSTRIGFVNRVEFGEILLHAGWACNTHAIKIQ